MAKRDYYREIIEKRVILPYGIDREEVKKAQNYNFFTYMSEEYSSVLLNGWREILEDAKSLRSDLHDSLSPLGRFGENLECVLFASIAIPATSIFFIPAEIANIAMTLARYPIKKKRKKEFLKMISKYLDESP